MTITHLFDLHSYFLLGMVKSSPGKIVPEDIFTNLYQNLKEISSKLSEIAKFCQKYQNM